MKFDRHNLKPRPPADFAREGWRFHRVCTIFLALGLCLLAKSGNAQTSVDSDANAHALALRTMERLAMGDAFDAKLRQRIWAGGRVVVGVGHYEQSGGGSGRYSLELTIHDGDTRQTIKQISDGKLSWHRSHIGAAIVVRRVDLGRIDEYERDFFAASPAANAATSLAPPLRLASHLSHPSFNRLPTRLLVGGLVELLDQINSDYNLRLTKGIVDRQPVWILRGQLSDAARNRIRLASPGRAEWAQLCPVEVRVAIAATADPSGFGAGLPIRIEFWSEPQSAMPQPPTAPSDPAPETASSDKTEAAATGSDAEKSAGNSAPAGRLISLLEIYSMRKIEPSPEERFRFVNDDRAVSFANETSRYLDRVSRP